MSKFYEIQNTDLVGGIEIKLETEYSDDWIQLFTERDGNVYSQFNEEGDLDAKRHIRIHSDFALAIWEMVEKKNVMDVKRAEIAAQLKMTEHLGY